MKLLDETDRGSATWMKVKAYTESRITSLQKELESDFDEQKTAKLRGRIVELRKLLTQGESPPIVNHPNADY